MSCDNFIIINFDQHEMKVAEECIPNNVCVRVYVCVCAHARVMSVSM